MSEFSRRARSRYQRIRRRRIVFLSLLCGFFAVVALGCTLLHIHTQNNAYVSYTNEGKVIYHAYLAENDFYSEESLNGTHAYVASLIKYMTADFRYELNLEATAKFRYSYGVNATLEIRDPKSNMLIYNPTTELLEAVERTAESKELRIAENVSFDYNQYNATARSFLNVYHLTDVTAALIVRMTVDVVGINETFEENLCDSYMIDVSIPLLQSTVTPSVSSTLPTGETRIRTQDDHMLAPLAKGGFAAAMVAATLGVLLYFAVTRTRDEYLEYAHAMRRLLTNYRSYIQRIHNDYTDDVCYWLQVGEFSELLEIRDTLQIPILLYENEERTHAKFFVANGGIVYYYILKV